MRHNVYNSIQHTIQTTITCKLAGLVYQSSSNCAGYNSDVIVRRVQLAVTTDGVNNDR